MNRRIWIVAACAALLKTGVAVRAADFYVSAQTGSPAGQGTQDSPFQTVQAAIDAAATGDTIRVATGTYTENLRIAAKSVVLEGGYSADWVRNLDANQTTLAGAGGNAVINLIESDATIDGFRITGGTGSTEEVPYGFHGGGIYSRDGSPTIVNNIIEANDIRKNDVVSDYHFGGGIYSTNGPSLTVRNNVIRGNFAGRGAGIAAIGTAATIEGNTIENNVGIGDHGGGLFIAVVNSIITRNVIRGNEIGRDLGYGWGGGVIVVGAGNTAELSFNQLSENFAAAYGAAEFIDEGATADIHHELIFRNVSKDGCEAVSAIAVDGGDGVGSMATIRHCTVANNVCANSSRGNGLQVEGLSTVEVTNCIFWNNGGDDFSIDGTSTLSVTFTDSQEPIAGTGNISANPLFVNEAANDYRLSAGSPCINAGDPASPFDQEQGDNGGRADMGRFGNASNGDAAAGDIGATIGGTGGGSGGDAGNGPSIMMPAQMGCGAMPPAMVPACMGLALVGLRMGARRRKPSRITRRTIESIKD